MSKNKVLYYIIIETAIQRVRRKKIKVVGGVLHNILMLLEKNERFQKNIAYKMKVKGIGKLLRLKKLFALAEKIQNS